jgi:hypothetical protein
MMNTDQLFQELCIKFNTDESFDTGYTALRGNAFKFDNYKSLKTLKFFTTEQLDNAVLQIQSHGLQQDNHFNLTTSL